MSHLLLLGMMPFSRSWLSLSIADGEPVTQLSVIQGVHHFKYLSFGEGQALRKLFLIFKMSSDEEAITSPRLQDVFIH